MALEKFHHKIGSKTIVLPKFENIPFGVLRKLRKESEVEQFFGIVEEVADAKTLTTLDTLTMPEVRDLMAAWQKNSAADMGESSAS